MTEILTKEQASTVHGTECWSERRMEETERADSSGAEIDGGAELHAHPALSESSGGDGEEPNARPSGRLDPDESGPRRREKFVKRARVIAAVGLALAWMVELGGEAVSAQDRVGRREIVKESMILDLQTGGTTFGVYPSSPGEIITRWTKVMREDEKGWRFEDAFRAFNRFILLLLSGFAVYFFTTPGGKVLVENYVENGVQAEA